MELFYHVYYIVKGKGCKFRFYLYKYTPEEILCISGDVNVTVDNRNEKTAWFGTASEFLLTDKEKWDIVDKVTRYLYF